MITALKAEFRKMFTVRSTYFITAISLALVVLFGGYIFGYKLKAVELLNPKLYQQGITGAITAVAVFGAIVGVLLVTHEYRYNTILYTITANRSRTVVLLAKILAASVFSLLFTTLICVASPLLSYAGIALAGHHAAPQIIPYADLIWKCLFFGWGYGMIAVVIAMIIRNQIGAIITLLVAPATIEGLLSLLLKKNSVYLPFSALNAVITPNTTLSAVHAAELFASYLGVGLLVAWVLFLRRDAN